MLSLLENNNILTTKEIFMATPYFLNIKHDKENDLYITKHCYKSDVSDPIVKQCDGTVLSATNKVACYSGEYSEQVTTEDIISRGIELSNYDMYELLDGTSIRMYYHNNEWITGTKGHTNASKSKWSSDKSFLELFQEALVNYPEFSTDDWNKNYTYVFVLQHVDNKIVCPCDSNKVYLVDVYDNTTLQRVTGIDVGVSIPEQLDMTIEQLCTFMKMGEDTVKGVCMHSKTGGERMNILTDIYESRQKLKGNTLNMEKQYLDLRCGNSHYEFTKQFPEYVDLVARLEQNIRNNVNHIHSLYMQKFVHRQEVHVSPTERPYLFAIHGFYLRTRNVIRKPLVENLMFVVNNQFGSIDMSTNHTR